jgi:cellulose biosynthesis protein BcsQ
MTVPVLTFFNNKGGVGKTSLVYHVAWMLSELDRRVLVVDLDPQANLTAAFLDEDELADLWDRPAVSEADTIYRCLEPLTRVGDLQEPRLRRISSRLSLLPGDLALSGFEDLLSTEWPSCLGNQNLYRAFRVVTAFWQVMQMGARQCGSDIVLVDVGPSLGAINRSALIATDGLVVPLGADLFSLQGLRNLGPTLRRWRSDWTARHVNWAKPEFPLPSGRMNPLGYVVQQHGVRLSRPVAAYDRWVRRIPEEYAKSVLDVASPAETTPDLDPNRIATLKHYRSLIPLGQDARKPIFHLTAADGALGSHSVAARDAFADFKTLALEIQHRMEAVASGDPS